MKPDFDKAGHRARQLRIAQSNSDLALDVRKMEFDLPIIIDTFQNYASITGIPLSKLFPCDGLKDGYTIIAKGVYVVLYDDRHTYGRERLNWTLAHEIGHIYLGHNQDGKNEEIEAHWFAAELLSPEPIIKEVAERLAEYGIPVKAFDLAFMFSLSKEAALKRINSINRKCMWDSTYAEQLVEKYDDAIAKYCSTVRNVYKNYPLLEGRLEGIRL